MKLNELFPQVSGPLGAVKVTGLSADSRQIGPGMVFAALKGVASEGRDYIPQAIEAGAVAVLGEGDAPDGVPFISVGNARLALAEAAASFYRSQPGHVAAVTGTNGKSSTVDFARQLWEACGRRAASLGTLGAIGPSGHMDLGHTTPDPVAIHKTLAELAEDRVTHVAMEASSHGLVQYRLDGVKLASGAFTNLTQDHLDYHPSFSDYRAAKLRLFSELVPLGCPVLVNADSDEAGAFLQAANKRGLSAFTFGWRGADLKLRELMPKATGQDLDLLFRGAEVRLHLPLIGEFQALNALTAAAMVLVSGERPEAVFEGLKGLKPVVGRMERIGETKASAQVFVDYAHTPDGLETLLRAARPHTAGNLVCVFGCGGDRDRTKRPLMGRVAARFADRVIVTDDNPRSEDPEAIRAAILDGAPEALAIGDRRAAIEAALAGLDAGDTLVVAGKGHETGQVVGDQVLPFSDQSVIRDLLGVTHD